MIDWYLCVRTHTKVVTYIATAFGEVQPMFQESISTVSSCHT